MILWMWSDILHRLNRNSYTAHVWSKLPKLQHAKNVKYRCNMYSLPLAYTDEWQCNLHPEAKSTSPCAIGPHLITHTHTPTYRASLLLIAGFSEQYLGALLIAILTYFTWWLSFFLNPKRLLGRGKCTLYLIKELLGYMYHGTVGSTSI